MERAARVERSALVVDDDVFIVSALAEVLEDDGYDVHTATNGFSAMRQAIQQRPSVILLDLVLPERSGGELLQDLRSEPLTRELAIVVVSANVDRMTERERADTDAIICKPFDVGELLGTVEQALQRAAGRRAEVAPVAATTHREPGLRARHAANPRRSWR